MTSASNLETILLVDDDEFIQDIYATKFGEEGLSVTAVDDGDAALQKLDDQDYDVILLDLIMPGTDGMEMLEAMQAEGMIANNCIIILSNQGQPEDIDEAQEYDIDGYIIKASNVPSEVLEEVKNIYQQNYG